MSDFETLEKKSLILIKKLKIKHFSGLIKQLKISKSNFYKIGLHKSEKIMSAFLNCESDCTTLKKHQKKTKKPSTKKTKKSPQKPSTNKTILSPVRDFAEIQAKLFIFRAYKQKNYEKLNDCAKKIIDRQIFLLEWVLKKDEGDRHEGN